MKQTLAAAGLDFRHVVFVNPYLTDQASAQMNAIYAKHFEFGNTPARATIRVASLPGGNTIEFTGVAVADLSKRVAVRPKNMRPSATASPCVFAGDTYYCSAKGPFTPGPDKAQGIFAATVEAQVRQTMRNLLDGLEEAGLTFSNVVASNVYLDNIDDFPRMNRVYAQYFRRCSRRVRRWRRLRRSIGSRRTRTPIRGSSRFRSWPCAEARLFTEPERQMSEAGNRRCQTPRWSSRLTGRHPSRTVPDGQRARAAGPVRRPATSLSRGRRRPVHWRPDRRSISRLASSR